MTDPSGPSWDTGTSTAEKQNKIKCPRREGGIKGSFGWFGYRRVKVLEPLGPLATLSRYDNTTHQPGHESMHDR